MEALKLGGKIDHYELLGELGRGGMSVVFKANEVSLHRTVALKVLHKDLVKESAFLEAFYQEARAMARLEHPNIVTIYNVGRDQDRHFIAMEYIQGAQLSEMIQNHGSLGTIQVLRITLQIAQGLGAAHRAGIVHRDIKPNNIMVDQSGKVKITDFGNAKVRAALSRPVHGRRPLVGTPAYMSPEHFSGESVDGRSDLYSVGVVMYEMLTGRLPFAGETIEDVTKKILHDTPPEITDFNPDVPRSVSRLVQRAMAKSPADRFQTIDELREAIETLLQINASSAGKKTDRKTANLSKRGFSPAQRKPNSGGGRSRFFGRRKVRIVGMGLGLILIAAVTYALLTRDSDRGRDEIPGTPVSAIESTARSILPPPAAIDPSLRDFGSSRLPDDARAVLPPQIERAPAPPWDSNLAALNADLTFTVRSALARRIEEGGGVIFVIHDSEDGGAMLEAEYLFISTVPPPALPSLTLQASGPRWQP